MGAIVHQVERSNMNKRCKSRHGFTLIEMLITVVVIGSLAAIVAPKFAGTRERALDATVVSDLRNALAQAEGYFSISMTYPATAAAADFAPSPGVIFTTWTANGLSSILLEAEHSASSHRYVWDYPNDFRPQQFNK